jgi:hypothetical protein
LQVTRATSPGSVSRRAAYRWIIRIQPLAAGRLTLIYEAEIGLAEPLA